MNDTTCNGWKNYETWATALWLGNDESLYNLTRDMAAQAHGEAEKTSQVIDGIWSADQAQRFNLSDSLAEFVKDECLPNLGACLASDLLNAAVSEVDWHEIAENLLSEVEEA